MVRVDEVPRQISAGFEGERTDVNVLDIGTSDLFLRNSSTPQRTAISL